jgi:hypothetical protein
MLGGERLSISCTGQNTYDIPDPRRARGLDVCGRVTHDQHERRAVDLLVAHRVFDHIWGRTSVWHVVSTDDPAHEGRPPPHLSQDEIHCLPIETGRERNANSSVLQPSYRSLSPWNRCHGPLFVALTKAKSKGIVERCRKRPRPTTRLHALEQLDDRVTLMATADGADCVRWKDESHFAKHIRERARNLIGCSHCGSGEIEDGQPDQRVAARTQFGTCGGKSGVRPRVIAHRSSQEGRRDPTQRSGDR